MSETKVERQTPGNERAQAVAMLKLQSAFPRVMKKGYHGELTLKMKIQDGVAQNVDVSYIEVERF